MEHQVPAHEPAAVGDALREPVGFRVQHQPGRADTVAGEDDERRPLALQPPLRVVVEHAARHAVPVQRDLAHPAAGAQLHARAQQNRPVRQVRAGLGAGGAAQIAGAGVDAPGAAVVVAAEDRCIRWPPVPALTVEAARQRPAQFAERERRQRRRIGRIGRVPGQARCARDAVVGRVVGLQRRVIHRPVVAHAVQRTGAEIRRMHARPVRREVDGRAAHGIEVDRGDRRVLRIDRVVLRQPPHVGVAAELGIAAQLVVGIAAGIGRVAHHRSLLQAEDAHARAQQRPGEGRAGGAGAHDQHIDGIVAHAGR